MLTGRAVFTEAYAVIPKGVMQRHRHQRAAVLGGNARAGSCRARLSGFAETFSQYIMEVAPGGGSDRPEPDAGAEGVLFVMEGELTVTIAGETHRLQPGGYAFLPPACGLDGPQRRRRAGALPLDPQAL